MNAAEAGWEGILDKDERVIWQGRPDTRFEFRPRHIPTLLFGIVFAGFAVFWMIMAASAPGGFWMFGLIHFSVGVGLALGPMLWPVWRRRHTWYTLTDQRAFIATDMPIRGRRLDSYPINGETVLGFDNGTPASVHFAHVMKRTKNGSRRVDIGFERIEDGQEVYRLIRQVQKDNS